MNKNSNELSDYDLNRVIVVALERMTQAFRTLIWDYAKQKRLSPIQIQFLIFIAAHPENQSFVTEIAREFSLTAPTVSDAIKSMEQKGLVKKTASPQDKRRFYLRLTPAGKNITRNLVGWQNPMIEHLEQFPIQTKKVVMLFLLELVESLKRDNVIGEAKTCLSCKYFQKNVHGKKAYSHQCLLRDVAMSDLHLRLDCPNYEPEKRIEGA